MRKNILISGGSGSLGRYLIKKYSEKNYNIINLSRSKPKKLLKNEFFYKCNLEYFNEVELSLVKIKEKFKLDFLISCAGKSKKNYKNFISDENFIQSFKDNFLSFSNLLESYQKIYKNKKIKIIVISSIAGSKFINAPINYSITKSALNHYSQIKAKELSKYKIQLNLISPGNILIRNNNWDLKLNKNKKKITQYLNKNVPLRIFIKPNEIYQMCEYILNKNIFSLTGSNLIIDGGQSL